MSCGEKICVEHGKFQGLHGADQGRGEWEVGKITKLERCLGEALGWTLMIREEKSGAGLLLVMGGRKGR